jgi:hypothetical protein
VGKEVVKEGRGSGAEIRKEMKENRQCTLPLGGPEKGSFKVCINQWVIGRRGKGLKR